MCIMGPPVAITSSVTSTFCSLRPCLKNLAQGHSLFLYIFKYFPVIIIIFIAVRLQNSKTLRSKLVKINHTTSIDKDNNEQKSLFKPILFFFFSLYVLV